MIFCVLSSCQKTTESVYLRQLGLKAEPRRRLIEEIKVHVGFFFLFLLRSRGSGGGTTTSGAAGGRRTRAARRHRGELLVAFGNQFGNILAFDFRHERAELGVIDFSGGCYINEKYTGQSQYIHAFVS